MAYDGLVMAAITHELGGWVDARVEKVYQPASAVLVLLLHHQQLGRSKLLLSAEPSNPRMHLTAGKWSNPANPPMFCMLLRKYLEGGRLLLVQQFGLERVVTLSFTGRDELGNTVTYRLIAEVMGRHSNILLVNQDGKILDSIIRVPPAMSSVRIILPGLTYSFPTHQARVDTLSVEGPAVLQTALSGQPVAVLSKALVSTLTGISPVLASEILFRAKLQPTQTIPDMTERDWANLGAEVAVLGRMVQTGGFQPSRTDKQYAALMLTYLQAEPWTGSMNELVDRILSDESTASTLQRHKQQLLVVVKQLLHKDLRKETNQAQELEEMLQDLSLGKTGELILASMHLIQPKAESAQVVDYYDPDLRLVEIALDSRLSAAQNAQRCFRRYERARHGKVVVEQNLVRTRSTIAYLESLQDSIERADQLALLLEIQQEMRLEGLIPSPAKGKAPASSPSEPLHFTSPDGLTILVGRNNLQNDRLTRSADPNDWWLHTKDIPGSHVIVRSGQSPLSDATLQLAAGLAAFYSQARQSSKVPVDYTRRKHVRKPSGAPPGFVIYGDQQTILIEPSLPTAIEK